MIIELPGDAHRVSLRRVDGDGRASDVVGHLVAANAEQIVVLPEDKPAVWLPRAEVRNLRRVPERVVLPASPPDALQRVLDKTWPGLRRARLGGWVLRAGRGRTKRANSVLAGGDPGTRWREAVAMATDWYGTPPVLQVVADHPLVSEAVSWGYGVLASTIVMVARLDDLVARPMASTADAPGKGFVGLWSAGELDPDLLAEATASPARYVSTPGVASGRVAIERDWAVLSCLAVAPERRGEGLGRAVVAACVAEARGRARFVALQVEEHDARARALYEAEGFEEHHRYCYLSPTR